MIIATVPPVYFLVMAPAQYYLNLTKKDLAYWIAILKSDGSGGKYLHMKAGGSLRPASAETVAAKEHYIYQEGQSVFKFAVVGMADVAYELMQTK